MSHYISYYDSQVGGGGIDHVFIGSPYQRDRGIGSFLAGLLRRALPLLKSGAQTVGKQAFRTGLNVIDDINAHNVPFKEALRRRKVAESGNNLKRKASEKIGKLMEGSGYKKRSKKKSKQLKSSKKRGNISRKIKRKRLQRKKTDKKKTVRKKQNKKKRSLTDIFGP